MKRSGLARSFFRLPHSQPFCCFFLSHFLQPNAHKAQSHPRSCGGLEPCQPSKAKRRRVLQPPPPYPLVPEKNNPKLLKHNVALWYIPQGLRYASGTSPMSHNNIMLSSRTEPSRSPASLPENHNSPPPFQRCRG